MNIPSKGVPTPLQRTCVDTIFFYTNRLRHCCQAVSHGAFPACGRPPHIPPAPGAGSPLARPKRPFPERKKQQLGARSSTGRQLGVGGGFHYGVEMRCSIRGGWRSFSSRPWFSDTTILAYATRVHPARPYTTSPQLEGEKGILVRDPAGKRSDLKYEIQEYMYLWHSTCSCRITTRLQSPPSRNSEWVQLNWYHIGCICMVYTGKSVAADIMTLNHQSSVSHQYNCQFTMRFLQLNGHWNG